MPHLLTIHGGIMNSTYDKELHVAVPTLDYIKRMTGFDILLEEGNKERAEAKVRGFTAKARDLLFMDRSSEAQRVISYLIYKETWIDAWLNYVVRYIEATFYQGDESAWATVPRPILNAIYGSVLQYKKFTSNITSEVRNTTEEF